MTDAKDPQILTFGPSNEAERRGELIGKLREWPIPDRELLLNLGLFLTPQTLSRVLFMDHLYQQIIDLQGIVVELGCRWGQNLSLFTSLRGIYEPFNRLRKVVGFDSFSGFPSVAPEDGALLTPGDYATTSQYEMFLEQVLGLLEQESPLSHLRKYEVIRGDATQTVPQYLKDNPQTVIALAYFDFDIYGPTKTCLEALYPFFTKGTVIGFDEANDPTTPGETVALREVLGLNRYSLRRYRFNSRTSYLVID